ncbi:hypothetical protein PV328_000618 [Microctonus aethiopoides]|uniref:FAM21/CAPZIP domain-containing protein n=1 Tax=Microctonus aethiopoides TaxID=144406 RepID=A0AA39KWQ3_9HYME|nr:hypothetical protein PV328_000618 [Microctonus aethiopoides]
MNSSTTSDETGKIWDHPWSTDEMRQYRSDWNLAGDVGLLRHLQQFSENLTASVKNTQTTLDLLNSQLNETTVLIDNVTNASLALANTQFIESRVYEDDTDNEVQQDNVKKSDEKNSPNTEIMTETEMIAAVSENIQRGLAVMDEKYERLEVISSDSEDENEKSQPSFILRPKDPYQNRPLPYVIGTDKWKSSNKIGLESSSSESDVIDDDNDDDETESDKDMDELSQHIFLENSRRISILRRSSLSSSGSSDFNEKSITNKQYSETSSHTDNKLYTRSQDTLNSTSEITTPTAGLSRRGESSTKDAPSFAEELAKRLGNVMPINKTKVVEKRDANQSSINRQSKNDFFANYGQQNDNYDDENGHIFNDKSDNLFGGTGGLFDDDDDEVSNSLWRDKSIQRPQTNIIPPSLDVPPPMHSTEIKRNTAIDDLFGDNDSDDSDDIFAPRNSNKSTIKSIDTVDVTKNSPVISNIIDNKLLTVSQQTTNKIASSTPENNNNVPNLFEDDENDGNLFGSPQKSNSNKQSPESSQNPQRGRPPGILVSQSDLLSSSLGSRLFKRQESSDSSENNSENVLSNASKHEDKNTPRPSENNSSISSIRDASNRVHIETSDSSGISTHPQSMNSTLSIGASNHWNPQMESTRLPSDELYRERVTSDSLLNTKTRQQVSNNSGVIASNDNPSSSSNRIRESNNIYEENLFDNDDDDDDVFSPPPLPNNKSKSVSKVTSLFDDSDSGDDLFSNTSSGSRSQKSADILTNLTQQQLVEKFKSGQKRVGLFDEGVDIFANKNSSSSADISTSGLTSKEGNQFTKQSPQLSVDTTKETIENPDNISNKLLTSLPESKSVKSTSIFDDSEPEDEDLFSSIIHSKPVVNKFNDENNFFATTSVNSADRDGVLTVPKKDFTVEPAEVGVVGDKESKVSVEKYNRNDNQPFVTSKISENKLFDDSDDDDDDDDDDDNLFSQKQTVVPQIKTQQNHSIVMDKSVDEKVDSVFQSVKSQKISMDSSNKSNEFDEIHSENKDESKSAPIMDDTVVSKVSENLENSPPEIHLKKEPPKSLKIRLPVVGAVEDPNIPPRRAVSGKIKDLMGKMGDLKILSPTDTPLPWRKSENPTSEEDNDNDTPDRDSEDGSSISVPSTKSLPTLPKQQIMKKESPKSPSIETETAVSFDVPAQADTLTVTASKSRVRIPVKRRPQSRHARQSALRISGIDFDTVDTVADSSSDFMDSSETVRTDSKIERLIKSNDGSDGDGDGSLIKPVKPTLNIISDDKSEFSLGKESSVSITKNTLLSPSTDEEDLFDVPPDLPEDPQKEDSLFGRAPILSPIPRPRQDNLKSSFIGKLENAQDEMNSKNVNEKDSKITEKLIENKTDCDDNEEKLIDPLRDESRDPLKDPSQLFAFVTKTPSPEKGHNSLFKEDNSLFSQTIKKINDDTESAKKPSFDIFVNDSSSDLFSGPFTKATTKKPIKGTKGNLFSDLDSDDDDGTDDLFGSASSKRSNQSKSEHSDIDTNEVSSASGNSPKQIDPFDDDDDDLFFDASEKPSSEPGKDDQIFSTSTKVKKTKLEDIFGDQSSGEDDIFAIKKPIGRGATAGGLFFSDDGADPNDIFTKKQSSSSAVNVESVENRVPIKKAITRDLRKTAEKIVEDPLSMLHDD